MAIFAPFCSQRMGRNSNISGGKSSLFGNRSFEKTERFATNTIRNLVVTDRRLGKP